MLITLKPLTTETALNACACVPTNMLTFYDSYMYSPVYMLFTGRNGAWVYQNKGITNFVLSHPNQDNSLVILPAFDVHNGKLYSNISQNIAMNVDNSNTNISLGRFPMLEQNTIDTTKFILVSEDLLDWKYPTRILSTNDVYNLRGKNFQQIRQRLNQLNKTILHSKDIQINKDKTELLNVVYEWANNHNSDKYNYDDLTSPYRKLLELMSNKNLNLYGKKILLNGQIKSFCIYEIVNETIANEFAISADKNIPGLSEYQIYEMCKTLHDKGIKYVNLGGSETEGLDRFKKKFAPVISHHLQTYKIKSL